MRNPARLLRCAAVLAGVLAAILLLALPSAARADIVLLTVSKDGTGSGTVTSMAPSIDCGTVCVGAVERTSEVRLTATPAPGSRFAGWAGRCTGATATTCIFAMTGPLTVTATFNQFRTLTVATAGDGAGIVTSSPGAIACGGFFVRCAEDFDLGTTVTLTAAPQGGLSAFTGWSGGGCSGVGTCTVTVDAAKTVTATFAGYKRLLVTNGGLVQNVPGRTVSTPAGIDCTTGNCDAYFPPGTVVTLAMTPGAGASVVSSCGTFAGPASCQVTMDVDRTFNAKYTTTGLVTFVRAGNGEGTITGPGITCGATCTSLIEVPAPVTLTTPGGCAAVLCFVATPAPGSEFDGWSGIACADPVNCQGTVAGATTLTATFVKRQVLTVTRTGSGSGSVTSAPAGIDCGTTCSAPFLQDSTVTLTATPAAGSAFGGWSGAGCSGTGTCTVTMSVARSVTAAFGDVVTLTIRKPWLTTGSVTSVPAGIDCGATCTATVAKGSVVRLTTTPSAGVHFFGYVVDGGGASCDDDGVFIVDPFCSLTMTTSRTVDAYLQTPRTITITKAGTGTGDVLTVPNSGTDCVTTCIVPDADRVTFVATPADGSTFGGWTGDCAQQTRNICGLEILSDVSVGATFTSTPPPPTPPGPTPPTPTPPTPTPTDPGGTPAPTDPSAPAGTPTPVAPVVIDTRLVKVKVVRAARTATFTFAAVRGPKRFQCVLAKVGKKGVFAPCTSPKTYRNLKPGRYVFRVRTVGDTTPVVRTITVLKPLPKRT